MFGLFEWQENLRFTSENWFIQKSLTILRTLITSDIQKFITYYSFEFNESAFSISFFRRPEFYEKLGQLTKLKSKRERH